MITTNPNGVLGASESKKLSKKLADFNEKIPLWISEVSEEENRLMSLGVLIGQNKKIQREIIKNSQTDAAQSIRSKSIIKQISGLEVTVKEMIVKTKKHGKES